ncbi:MAG: endonuclease/exonuclease/phosphatase family protein [candidate division KSB1 bacterium]|nr:endonuclease/exonuclease/phosphatase family protein [candidate division KSB1 bacterium]MDZ7319424.1 endonuclease/exonuclease/phosphatase family protein [candidate division KSB1 bacterium]MDZ7340042.1 endonuclease/exonuclease/phosphatase family protein [candidate division KSB1 bacterium]
MKNSFVTLIFFIIVLCVCSDSGKRDDLKVMTFNIRYGTAEDGANSWEFRKTALLKLIQVYQPDILGTQEALEFQIAAIRAACPQYGVFGIGRYQGIELPDRPHESLDGESCRIFYDSTKFLLLQQGTFWHSDTPEIAGSMNWGNTLPRITTWGILQSRKTSQQWVVMNTHYHWDEPYVTNATKLILQRQATIAGKLPTILMGDFNLSPAATSHDLLCGQTKWDSLTGPFRDTWRARKKSETHAGTYHGFKGDSSGDRIDWILVTNEVGIKDIRILHDRWEGHYPSDHFPVLAVLQLK